MPILVMGSLQDCKNRMRPLGDTCLLLDLAEMSLEKDQFLSIQAGIAFQIHYLGSGYMA